MFSSDTVREMLCNAAYADYVSGRRDTSKTIKGLHEAVVPEELFDRVQLMRRAHARTLKPGRPSAKYVLRGLARCRRCHANMQGTSGGRDLKARYYCATRRANRSCDQPIIPAERVEQQLAQFLTSFAPTKTAQAEILHQLATPATREDAKTAKRRAALEERLRRMRDLYELGDIHRPEYVARRDAVNAELSALTPAPIPDLDQAQHVLEDFTIFWTRETDPAAKRQFLTLILDSVWLDHDRIVAVVPKPSFLPFFQPDRRPQTANTAGVKYGSDGTQARVCRLGDRDSAVGARWRCWSGCERQRLDVTWPHDAEVALVERHQLGDVQALGQGNDAGIGRAERQVGVLLDQLGGAGKVVSRGTHDVEEPGLE